MRMYFSGNRPFSKEHGSFIYDPVACWMLRSLCQKFDAKIVFNTAHNENPKEVMLHQANVNGIGDLMHEAVKTNFMTSNETRDGAIHSFVERHGVTDWIVIDDLVVYEPRQVLIDFIYGMTMDSYKKACSLFGEEIGNIVAINGLVHGD